MNKYEDIVNLWREWNVSSENDIDTRLHSFRILFAYNSGKIENDNITYNDTREVFENGRILNFTGSPRTLFELSNQKLCYEYLKPKIAARTPLSINIVKETHGVLTGGTYDERRFVERGERPGEFKKYDYVTGIAEVGSPPDDVEKDLADLLTEISDLPKLPELSESAASAKPPESAEQSEPLASPVSNGCGVYRIIKAAAYFHARFEYIHPFADGNGRAGRALMNYFLMINDHPPTIIYDDDKAAYYDALAAYDISEDISQLTEFLIKQTVRTWDKTLARERGR